MRGLLLPPMEKTGGPGRGAFSRRFWERMAILALIAPLFSTYNLIRGAESHTVVGVAIVFAICWSVAAVIAYWRRLWPFNKR